MRMNIIWPVAFVFISLLGVVSKAAVYRYATECPPGFEELCYWQNPDTGDLEKITTASYPQQPWAATQPIPAPTPVPAPAPAPPAGDLGGLLGQLLGGIFSIFTQSLVNVMGGGMRFIEEMKNSTCGSVPRHGDMVPEWRSDADAEISEVPWQLRLTVEMPVVPGRAVETKHCGAVLVTNSSALTLASCIDGYATIWVHYNSSDRFASGQKHVRVSKTSIHPQFRSRSSKHDIAVLHFSSLTLTDFTLPICVSQTCSEPGMAPFDRSASTSCVMSGWNTTLDFQYDATRFLQKGKAVQLNSTECFNAIGGRRNPKNRFQERITPGQIDDTFMCTRNGKPKITTSWQASFI